MSPQALASIPDHLKEYITEQDPDLYTFIDHASWRYIMRVSKAFFAERAHPLYLHGLDATDRRLLRAIIERFRGGPVGLHALAAATAEEVDTIAEVYEPFLLQMGFLERTPRGRVATRSAYTHLGMAAPALMEPLISP